MSRINIIAFAFLALSLALFIYLWAENSTFEPRHHSNAPSHPICDVADAECTLGEAIKAIKSADIKTARDEIVVIRIAYASALLGSDKLIQLALGRVDSLPNNIPPDRNLFLGTSPTTTKAQSRMLLLASLGRIPEALEIVKDLYSQGKEFEEGFEPQLGVVGTLTYAGKLELAKEFLKETKDIRFPHQNSITENKWPDGPPQVLLIEAYLNKDQLDKAREVADLLNGENVFSSSKGATFVQGIFARYYAAKGRPEFLDEHKRVCALLAKGLDNPKIYVGDPDPWNLHPGINYEFEAVIGNLYGAHCLSLYPEILGKINMEKFPGEPRFRDMVADLKNSPDVRSADEKVKQSKIRQGGGYYRHQDVVKGQFITQNCNSNPKIANGFSKCLVDELEMYHLLDNKRAEIRLEFDRKYP